MNAPTDQSMTVQTFTETSPIEGATCVLHNGPEKISFTTPGTIQVAQSPKELVIVCEKEGFDNGTTRVISRIGGRIAREAERFMVVPVVGFASATMDYQSGAVYTYPSNVAVYLGQTIYLQSPVNRSADQAEGESAATGSAEQAQYFTITNQGLIPASKQP